MDHYLFSNKRLTLGLALVLLNPQLVNARDDNGVVDAQQTEIKPQMQPLQQAYEQRINALEQRAEALEWQTSKQLNDSTTALPTSPINTSGFEIGLSGLFAAGISSVANDALENLQAGAHDPRQNGFTVQNVELSMRGTVGPYFNAQTNLIFQINTEGETVVELEEAFFTTRSLPWGLQVKGGQYFTEFGRQNTQHPHSWAFVDQPVVLSRFFGGDGLRSQGVRLAWLLPTDWYSEFYLGVQNPKGETVSSFLNIPGENIAGHTLLDRDARNFGDQLYMTRWLNGFDLSETLSMNLGISGLIGPNASGTDTATKIVGSDLYLKWQPVYSQRGYPFVSWHSEFLQREYEAGDRNDPSREILKDQGMFSQLLWGFTPGWVLGLRAEHASADGDTASDPLRDNRKRFASSLTWYASEYSKLRLQYNRDSTEHLATQTANSIFLQLEFNLGSHAAHVF